MAPNRTNKSLPKFFKFFNPRLGSASSEIPDAWVQHLNALPKNVVLQNRIGKVWRMKMEYADNRVYFANGWQQFVKDNSLVFGDCLVFQYNGDNGFNVKILGKSGCERNETGPHVGIDIEEEEEEEEHKIADAGTDFDDGHGSDSEYNVEEEEEEEEMEEEAPEGTATLKQRGKRICENDGEGSKKSAGVRARTSRELDNVLTRDEVRKYVHRQNPYFVSKQKQTRKSLLLVPSYVLRDFRIKLAEDVTFHDELEREWSGKVFRWKDGRTLITGWGSVCRWNHVEKDDLCICEFPEAGGTKNKILVHIKRSDGSQSQPTNQEPNQADQ
ncbi:putative B3 domain-containing protein At5g66980 [Pistacia vera]|uniref:putative B3 domain-containing protein At5g66980 n=1 Tax=Pistacia vera TaxID=55513 RepID=UPI001262DCD8|nr:putative B3 domain-containing protein At5g66980 [Pistacia vera]XP_031278159.1 putative B3 domain-containing protein At5g66980 [Pistacia vera]XP_031278160.1 putative B3 domain-containing protein At5g66980 [Pistacia vera]